MIQSINFPLYSGSFCEYQSWDDLRDEIHALKCDGLEGIWGGEDIPVDFPQELIVGYHLTFWSDWLDFYREDWPALKKKFGSLGAARSFYGGWGAETLLKQYRADLERAKALGARYVVFHVSDNSLEECYTYRWLHSDEEIIDAAVEVINLLLGSEEQPFDFLVENQWWPGFTFTEPEHTARLLDGIQYPRKGILLDTGHLMNTNLELRTQADGAAYIQEMLNRHGSLSNMIRGVHLHQSLSGEYVKRNTGCLPSSLPQDYVEAFGTCYGHVLQIDQHKPWTDAAILPVLERISPEYLTHELSVSDRAQRVQIVRQQRSLLDRGGDSDGCG